MFRRMLMGMTAAAIAITPGAALAEGGNGPAYHIYFYYDAAHTQYAGFAQARCNPEPHAALIFGQSTAYEQVVYIGQCIDGELYYD